MEALPDAIPFDLGDTFDDMPAVEVVISLAATADPREALRDPAAAYRNSTAITVQTLEYARHVGARVLHVSTNEALKPAGPYGGAKACQEIICQTYPDVRTTIVVTQSLFGERQQPDKLIPSVIRAILAGEPVKLQRGGARWASRPFLHARNLADALQVMTARDFVKPRVHIGAHAMISVREVADHLAAGMGRNIWRVEAIPAGDRAGHELDVRPIGCDLAGWRPSYPVAEALRDVAQWYLTNPEWLEAGCAIRS
jgi:nucleoside-diphosphate-sugar epimerase